MKNSALLAMFIGVAILLSLATCKQAKKGTVTDIPVTTSSKEALDFFQQGLALYDIGEGQKARTFFNQAIEQDPKMAIAYLFRAESSLSPEEFMNDMDQAKVNLEGISDWENMYYDYCATFLSSDWSTRFEIAQKIVSLYPEAARAQVNLGYTYLNGNEVAKARECFQKAMELDPKWVGGYLALGNSCLFNEPKDFKKAEENALQVIRLAPKSATAQNNLGDCYRAQNDLEKARDAYAKAIELDPTVSTTYFKKGHINTYLENYDAARQDYTEAGKLARTKQVAYQYIAYTYLYSGDYQSALQSLSSQIAALDTSVGKQSEINVIKLNLLDDYAGIASHNRDAAKLKETIPLIEPLYTQVYAEIGTPEAIREGQTSIFFWQAILAILEGNLDMATAKAEEIKTTLEPLQNPTKLIGYDFLLGYIAMQQKDYPVAIRQFENVQQYDVYYKYWLAMAYEAMGDKDKAHALYNEIVDYNFNTRSYALIRYEVKNKLAENI